MDNYDKAELMFGVFMLAVLGSGLAPTFTIMSFAFGSWLWFALFAGLTATCWGYLVNYFRKFEAVEGDIGCWADC